MRRVAVFCGANLGTIPEHAEAARALGHAIAGRGLGLVYGGGNVGLMGAIADAALELGGEVVGVIPHSLRSRELAHEGATEMHVVDSMHTRKALMIELSDAFIALPGGFGTLDELSEVVTWAQLGLHSKPMGILEVRGFYAPLIAFIDRAVEDGFIRDDHRAMLVVDTDPHRLLDALARERPAPKPRWVERGS